MTRSRLLCLLLLGLFSPLASGQGPDVPALARIKADLAYLAGPECNGRGVGTEGNDLAAAYIVKQFQAMGLKPAGTDGYFQPFKIKSEARMASPTRCTITGPGGQKLELAYGDQFKPVAESASVPAKGELVFVGFGIKSEKPAYDDFEGVDVKDKIVIVLRSTPQATKEKPAFNRQSPDWPGRRIAKVNAAVKMGAKGVIFVNDRTESKTGDDLLDIRDGAEGTNTIPVIHVKRAVLEFLLTTKGKSLSEIEAKIDEDLMPRSLALGEWSADIEVTIRRDEIPCKNVVGTLEGSGPLADETIVIGAHYDHLGTSRYGSLLGAAGEGKVHFGADDNASGTTGMMELARRFASQKNRVGRRLVFIAFSAEERGLFGSREYCNHPTFPLDKTAFMINLDMIGRSSPMADKTDGDKTKDRLVVSGLGTAEGLEKLALGMTSVSEFTIMKEQSGTGPSDHDSFYRKKVPVLFLYTGTHRDYHRPTDTPDKINYPVMLKIVDYVERLAKHFATGERVTYKVTSANFNDPTEDSPRRVQGPRLGIAPGNYEEPDSGVLVSDVTPGGAAEKGGIKSGDVVVEIAGNTVKNIGQYMTAMAKQTAGKEIEVVVLRNKKKMTVKVTPK